MDRPYYVHAFWDNEAGVWVASSDEVQGLATEAATSEELIQKLKVLIPELLALNRRTPSNSVPFELLTRRFEIAA